MPSTTLQSGTNIEEIASGIHRTNTPMHLPGDAGAFSFNQYLIGDDEPLPFDAGLPGELAAVLDPGTGGEPPLLSRCGSARRFDPTLLIAGDRGR